MMSRLRRAAARVLVVVLAGGGLAALSATPATAADLSQFEPGLIISDSIFYDSGTMGADAIQSFLSQKGASCKPAADGTACLKDYRQTTWTRTSDGRCASDYAGAPNETAAQIIAKVAQACGINPQVLIVTLQKEQSLITRTTAGSAAVYQKAMGYGCPDTAPCEAQYYGFFNQVYSAAAQFQRYAQRPTSYAHVAGRVNNVRFHPNTTCGTSQVYIQNQATASLYNYTPYQPNAAALAAGYGTGDGCSSYGNRNFWNYFTDWFGSTTQRAPMGAIDGIVTTTNSIYVGGWALDPDTTSSIDVHVYVDGVGVAVRAAGDRPDVDAAFHKGAAHGFGVTIPASAGKHTLCVYAVDSVGGPPTTLTCTTVTVVNRQPMGSIDTATGSIDSITLAGWALDPDTTSPIGVHVYVDGVWATATTAQGSRPDVGRAFGLGDAHGFNLVLPAKTGSHNVCVYGIDATGGVNVQLGCRTVTVENRTPTGSVDTVAGSATAITVSGWALDPDTVNPIGVHVYVDGQWGGATTAKDPRSDIGQAFGLGDAHGFNLIIPASVGKHSVCVYAIDATGGNNPQLGCRTVTVENRVPTGSVDTAAAVPGGVFLGGWALDPDTANPIGVHVYVDGQWGGATTAKDLRSDIGRVFGLGDAHGFNLTVPTSVGSHSVCVYAIDSMGGVNPQLSCRTVTVTS